MDPNSRETALCPAHVRPSVITPKKRYEHHHIGGKRIYGTYKWRKTSLNYRKKQPLCERCLRLGLVSDSVLVDHKQELQDGGDPFNEDNFEALCDSCHKRKTAAAARKRENPGCSVRDF